MRAALCHAYGGPETIVIGEVPKPHPNADEVLVRIHASTVSTGDRRVRSLDVPAGFGLIIRLVFGISKPRQPILGTDLAGVVEAVGAHVTRFSIGDAVVANVGPKMGCHAEYRCLNEKAAIVAKPEGLDFPDAVSLVFGATTAFQFLSRDAALRSGERLLVNGASGAIGSAAVQIGKALGAHVTAVCGPGKSAVVTSLGADSALDYTVVDPFAGQATYDVILDASGMLDYRRAKPAMADGGRLVLVAAGVPDMLKIPFASRSRRHKVIAGVAGESLADLQSVMDLAEAGHLRPVVSRRVVLVDIGAAHRAVDAGHKTGSVVVTMA